MTPEYPDLATFDRAFQLGRSNWQVQWPATDLRAEVTKAAAYHRQRLTWWAEEAETVKSKIGEDGLQVREQQITGGVRHDVVIDPTLSARLGECEQKQRGHRARAEALEGFDTFLEQKTGQQVTLLPADVEFFEIGQHEG